MSLREQVFNAGTAHADEPNSTLKSAHSGLQARRNLLTARELAAVLGRSERTIRRWHAVGDLPRQMAVSGELCWSRAAIDRWLDGGDLHRRVAELVGAVESGHVRVA